MSGVIVSDGIKMNQNDENTKNMEEFDKYLKERQEKLTQKIKRNQMDQKSSDWTENKFETLSNWMTIAAFYILIIDKCINRYKLLLKSNTIINMILSTLSGTISVFSFGTTENNNVLNILFTTSTFCMAIYSGYIKIDEVQEKLEEFIKLKQDWTTFSAALSAELVLPLNLRQSSVELINRYKSKFLDLIKTDVEYPHKYKVMIREEGYSLSQIINTFINVEDTRLKERSINDIPEEEKEAWESTKEAYRKLVEEEHRRLYIDYDEEFRIYHRENKINIKSKYTGIKPKELTHKLYSEYQKLLFNVKKDTSYFLKFYNYVALAIEERNKLQQYIDQEYNLIMNEHDLGLVTYILDNWYKEYLQHPEKKPNIITKFLKDKYNKSKIEIAKLEKENKDKNSIIQVLKENENLVDIYYYEYKGQVQYSIRSCLLKEGPAAFIYYISDFSGELYHKTEEKEFKTIDNKHISIYDKYKLSFLDKFSQLSKDDKRKKTEYFVDRIQQYFQILFDCEDLIKKTEQTSRLLFEKLNASQSASKYSISSLNKYLFQFSDSFFENTMYIVGSEVKLSRERYQMYRNPFYRILHFQGLNPTMLYPELNRDTILKTKKEDLVSKIIKKYKYESDSYFIDIPIKRETDVTVETMLTRRQHSFSQRYNDNDDNLLKINIKDELDNNNKIQKEEEELNFLVNPICVTDTNDNTNLKKL
jgi:hypothetical protein